MARHRTPDNVRDIKGMDKKNPSRKNQNQVVVERGIGEPPPHMNPTQIKIWNEVVSNMHSGVLSSADRIALEIIVGLIWRYRYWHEDDSILPLSGAELSTLRGMLGQFGMTPTDRAKLSIPEQKPKNEFSDF